MTHRVESSRSQSVEAPSRKGPPSKTEKAPAAEKPTASPSAGGKAQDANSRLGKTWSGVQGGQDAADRLISAWKPDTSGVSRATEARDPERARGASTPGKFSASENPDFGRPKPANALLGAGHGQEKGQPKGEHANEQGAKGHGAQAKGQPGASRREAQAKAEHGPGASGRAQEQGAKGQAQAEHAQAKTARGVSADGAQTVRPASWTPDTGAATRAQGAQDPERAQGAATPGKFSAARNPEFGASKPADQLLGVQTWKDDARKELGPLGKLVQAGGKVVGGAVKTVLGNPQDGVQQMKGGVRDGVDAVAPGLLGKKGSQGDAGGPPGQAKKGDTPMAGGPPGQAKKQGSKGDGRVPSSPAQKGGGPPGQAKKHGSKGDGPPGLAKKGGEPPGQAKKQPAEEARTPAQQVREGVHEVREGVKDLVKTVAPELGKQLDGPHETARANEGDRAQAGGTPEQTRAGDRPQAEGAPGQARAGDHPQAEGGTGQARVGDRQPTEGAPEQARAGDRPQTEGAKRVEEGPRAGEPPAQAKKHGSQGDGPPGLTKKGGEPPGQAKKHGSKGDRPPGLTKKGGEPPGQAKKHGSQGDRAGGPRPAEPGHTQEAAPRAEQQANEPRANGQTEQHANEPGAANAQTGPQTNEAGRPHANEPGAANAQTGPQPNEAGRPHVSEPGPANAQTGPQANEAGRPHANEPGAANAQTEQQPNEAGRTNAQAEPGGPNAAKEQTAPKEGPIKKILDGVGDLVKGGLDTAKDTVQRVADGVDKVREGVKDLATTPDLAQKAEQATRPGPEPPGQARKHGSQGDGARAGQGKKHGSQGDGPPGLAKKGGEPPGQARKHGSAGDGRGTRENAAQRGAERPGPEPDRGTDRTEPNGRPTEARPTEQGTERTEPTGRPAENGPQRTESTSRPTEPAGHAPEAGARQGEAPARAQTEPPATPRTENGSRTETAPPHENPGRAVPEVQRYSAPTGVGAEAGPTDSPARTGATNEHATGRTSPMVTGPTTERSPATESAARTDQATSVSPERPRTEPPAAPNRGEAAGSATGGRNSENPNTATARNETLRSLESSAHEGATRNEPARGLESSHTETTRDEPTRNLDSSRTETSREGANRTEPARSLESSAHEGATRNEPARGLESSRTETTRNEPTRNLDSIRTETSRDNNNRTEPARSLESSAHEGATRNEPARGLESSHTETTRDEPTRNLDSSRTETSRDGAKRTEPARTETNRNESARNLESPRTETSHVGLGRHEPARSIEGPRTETFQEGAGRHEPARSIEGPRTETSHEGAGRHEPDRSIESTRTERAHESAGRNEPARSQEGKRTETTRNEPARSLESIRTGTTRNESTRSLESTRTKPPDETIQAPPVAIRKEPALETELPRTTRTVEGARRSENPPDSVKTLSEPTRDTRSVESPPRVSIPETAIPRAEATDPRLPARPRQDAPARMETGSSAPEEPHDLPEEGPPPLPRARAIKNAPAEPIEAIDTRRTGTSRQEELEDRLERLLPEREPNLSSVREKPLAPARKPEETAPKDKVNESGAGQEGDAHDNDGSGGGDSDRSDQRDRSAKQTDQRRESRPQTAAGTQAEQQAATSPTRRLAVSRETYQLSLRKLDLMAVTRTTDAQMSRHVSQSLTSVLRRVYRQQELESMDQETAVNSLGVLLKLGGDFTFDHSARVLEMAVGLADQVGITDRKTLSEVRYGALLKDIGDVGLRYSYQSEQTLDQVGDFLRGQDIRRAGLLHDIGKTQIPNNILLKAGKLTPQEFQIMKMHPIYGEEMVYPIPALRPLCPAIRSHHERWDGQGYPDGLRQEQIPLAARIIAVADVFDALSAPRPYKPGMPIDEVWSVMRAGRGTHFDPVLLDAFRHVLMRRYPHASLPL